MRKVSRSSTVLLLLSVASALVSLACSVLPIYVIRPFRPQGARELAVALFVKQVSPAVSVVCAVLAVIALFAIWSFARMSSRRWWARIALALPAMLATGGALLARVNVYEIMFHPIDSPRFDSAEKAVIDPGDMVMAVEVNRVQRAYPIREMAYHHVVNDTVGGVPIVATY
jgi:hypothetical protein